MIHSTTLTPGYSLETTHTERSRSRSARRRMTIFGSVTTALAIGVGPLAAAPAWAHDTLVSSTPEADSVLELSPTEIVLEFSGNGLTTGENIPNEIWVTDADGENWEGEERAQVSANELSIEIPEPLPNGEYTVLYNVVYSDGHNEELSFNFEVDEPVFTTQDTEPGSESEDESTTGAGSEDSEQESPAATPDSDEPEPEQAASETAPEAAESDALVDPSTMPSWAPIAFGLAGVGVVVAILVLVRRKMKQVEQWEDSGSGNDAPEGTDPDNNRPENGDSK